ncbi:MAG TPA: protein-methionine-sulfoxide reductase heme-binding subunit MsrQ [Bryobacteraceae bacterium]|nr:protein-methionine-sulfoxide reductase heme-binding subunit MsrQ [Bryobacteraceae bacterium]
MLRSRWLKVVAFLLCLAPLVCLTWRIWNQDLTANPVEYFTHFTGDWTIRLLTLTLAVTPLRRLLVLPDLIRFRRMLGLYSFFYATLHVLTYLAVDRFFDFHAIIADVAKRRFITVGFAGYLALTALAVTSTSRWIRRLGGKRWQRLHRLVYFAIVAGVVHYYWLVKSDIRLPAFYGALAVLLLGYRAATWWGRRNPKPHVRPQPALS